MNDDRTEATRVAYEECPAHRTDYTHGDWQIPQSPFKTGHSLAVAMSKYTKRAWIFDYCYEGGRGDCPCLICEDYEITIWRDASGGFHPEKKVGSNWLPNLDLLEKLIKENKPQEFDVDPISGNYTADEVSYMRHPD